MLLGAVLAWRSEVVDDVARSVLEGVDDEDDGHGRRSDANCDAADAYCRATVAAAAG